MSQKDPNFQNKIDSYPNEWRLRKRQFAFIGLSILLIVTMGAAVLALRQRNLAQANARNAESQAALALAAQETAVANQQIAATRVEEAEFARATAAAERQAVEFARATAEARRQEAENQAALAEDALIEAEQEWTEAERQRQIALVQSLVELSSLVIEQPDNNTQLAAIPFK